MPIRSLGCAMAGISSVVGFRDMHACAYRCACGVLHHVHTITEQGVFGVRFFLFFSAMNVSRLFTSYFDHEGPYNFTMFAESNSDPFLNLDLSEDRILVFFLVFSPHCDSYHTY